MFAVLFCFGLKNQIGAGQLSEFFQLIRINTHVGVSESGLRKQLTRMEACIAAYQQQCESSASPPMPDRTVAMDETFFRQLLILVMMDLPSGYILLEESAPDRGFDTWNTRASARLKTLGLTVRHAISDRAKALIKLSVEGFGCVAGADLFHAQYELSHWLALPLARATQQAASQLDAARNALQRQQAKPDATPAAIHSLQVTVGCAERTHQDCVAAQQAYQYHQQAISDIVHPFDPATGLPQDQATVLTALQQESTALKTLSDERLIQDKKDRLQAFINQQNDLSQHVGVWWLWINTLLEEAASEPAQQAWITHQLMPVVYWHYRWSQTRKKATRLLYRRAWGKALSAFQQHTVTQQLSHEQISYWQQWCEDKVSHFERTSSAVEGRNGWLSQLYHNGRGLTASRLTALTVIHNYGTRRADGSTPANRLFGQDFPDLFESLLEEMGPLPLPRKRRDQKKSNSLIQKDCPALCG